MKPGSDVEEYIQELERVLEDKIESITGLQNLMCDFKIGRYDFSVYLQ